MFVAEQSHQTLPSGVPLPASWRSDQHRCRRIPTCDTTPCSTVAVPTVSTHLFVWTQAIRQSQCSSRRRSGVLFAQNSETFPASSAHTGLSEVVPFAGIPLERAVVSIPSPSVSEPLGQIEPSPDAGRQQRSGKMLAWRESARAKCSRRARENALFF